MRLPEIFCTLAIVITATALWQGYWLYDLHTHRINAICGLLSCVRSPILCKQNYVSPGGYFPCILYNVTMNVGGIEGPFDILLNLKQCPASMFDAYYDSRDPYHTFNLERQPDTVWGMISILAIVITSWGAVGISSYFYKKRRRHRVNAPVPPQIVVRHEGRDPAAAAA